MAEQQNEVALTFGDKLVDQLTVVQKALPADFNQARFVQNALAVLNGNPGLQKCTKSSLMEGLLKGAFLGLDFMSKECYLIPYENKATFQTDYKGEVKFTKKYSKKPIKEIYAKVVRKGDDFQETITDGKPSIQFSPLPFNGADIVGAFAVCLYTDDSMIYEAMSITDIQAVRKNYSKASQSKAWTASLDEMCKKVVIRRLCKHIDTDFESVEAHNAWEVGSGMEFADTSSAVDHSDIVQPFGRTEPDDSNVVADVEAVFIEDAPNFK